MTAPPRDYPAFLASKAIVAPDVGFVIAPDQVHPALYDFQRMLVLWALRKGRAALFADTGLGKTLCQLEWARHIPGTTLIVAPLSVARQTIAEAAKFLEITVRYVRHQDEMETEGISITNYDMIKHFIGVDCAGIVLDESSVLKSEDGKTRSILCEQFQHIPYRLCCTATPAPNDISEITNHAAFLGVMAREKVLATFFVHDDSGWRLRGHAAPAFYRWLTSWAMAMTRPDDFGFDGTAYVLPPLRYQQHVVATNWRKDGELFAGRLSGITDRASVRRKTTTPRIAEAVRLAQEAEGSCVIWCGLNDESRAVTVALGDDAIELHGTQSRETKLAVLEAFLGGRKRILVTKPKIAGRGMNFQIAHTQIFLGLSDSQEDYYQCIRRLWRYGQTSPVDVHIIVSDHETAIIDNVRRKESEALHMTRQMVSASTTAYQEEGRTSDPLPLHVTRGEGWKLYHGDCVEAMAVMEPHSVDLSVFSPPFMALYQYTGTTRDVGNSKSQGDFFRHFKFVAKGLLRVTKPGRLCAMHLIQVPAMQVRDGYIGMKDFRGPMISHMESRGWIFHGEAVIQKNPQAQAIRIHAKGLSFGQLEKDSSWSRPAVADMLLLFRAPGENQVPVKPDCTRDEWIQWAHPIWLGIRETHTLNAAEGRAESDDRHVCPLQLDVINRCIRLWSNRGERIFDPFAGIGSTGYTALQLGRQSVGAELKGSYAATAEKNYERALVEQSQQSLFMSATP